MSQLHIPVVKGKGSVSVETDNLDDKYYAAALASGLKTLINGGATKIVKPTDETDEAAMASFHSAAMAKAQERVLGMMKDAENPLKLGRGAGGTTKSDVPAAVMTEARRIARQLVKDTLRANGQKVSHYSASDITTAANAIIADRPELIKMAEDNIASRSKTTIPISLGELKEDPKLVAAAAKKKAEKAKPKASAGVLSATQAGKLAPRAQTAH